MTHKLHTLRAIVHQCQPIPLTFEWDHTKNEYLL
jgi:hypothetical protein